MLVEVARCPRCERGGLRADRAGYICEQCSAGFPVIGRFRYWFEELGEYFRQYFFANDREEMPFNRATRSWVYRLSKNEGGIIGFGSSSTTRAFNWRRRMSVATMQARS